MPKNNYHAKLLPNQVYHIYNHAVGKENLFKQSRNYAYFWEKWNKYISPYFYNYAFCLMPNHFHVLAKAKSLKNNVIETIENEKTKKAFAFLNNEVEINTFYESQFQRLFSTYSKAINKQEENRYGSLFKAKFRRNLISTSDDFIHYVQYIHLNPIHHGFVEKYDEWEFSSYRAYTEEEMIKGLSTKPVIKLFGDKEGNIQNFTKSHEYFKKSFRRD